MDPITAAVVAITYLFGKGFADEASRDAYLKFKGILNRKSETIEDPIPADDGEDLSEPMGDLAAA